MSKFLSRVDVLVIVTLILIISLTIALGYGVEWCRVVYRPVGFVADYLFDLLEVGHVWRQCRLSTHKDRWDRIVRIYQTSRGVNDLIKRTIRYQSNNVSAYWICHPRVKVLFRVGIDGMFVTGFLGFVGHFLYQVREWLRNGGGGRMMIFIAVHVCWFHSIGDRALGRLTLIVGCCISLRILFLHTQMLSRQLNSWIGDVILEPHLEG